MNPAADDPLFLSTFVRLLVPWLWLSHRRRRCDPVAPVRSELDIWRRLLQAHRAVMVFEFRLLRFCLRRPTGNSSLVLVRK